MYVSLRIVFILHMPFDNVLRFLWEPAEKKAPHKFQWRFCGGLALDGPVRSCVVSSEPSLCIKRRRGGRRRPHRWTREARKSRSKSSTDGASY